MFFNLILILFFYKASSFNISWDAYLKLFPDSNIHGLSKFHFLDNVKYIIQENSKNHTYKLGLTKFLHLSHDEWRSRFHNLTMEKSTSDQVFVASNLRGTPESFSWVSLGKTTPVKDQGTCGSCFSLSATETVETAYAIKTNKLIVLSPQQVVDCSKLNSGCNGGMPSRVYSYLEKTAQCSEADYPYVSGPSEKEGTCHECFGAVPKLKSYASVKKGDEKAMLSAILINSLAVAIQADQKEFQMYSSGVLDFNCGTDLDHAVTAEGYGTEGGKDYWLVRNSWGTSWGDKGYIKMVRGNDLCGIADVVVYPIF